VLELLSEFCFLAASLIDRRLFPVPPALSACKDARSLSCLRLMHLSTERDKPPKSNIFDEKEIVNFLRNYKIFFV
jgi:hypothetical protein